MAETPDSSLSERNWVHERTLSLREDERIASGFTEEQQEAFHANVSRVYALNRALLIHESACDSGLWTPLMDEKLWAMLPGEPPKFPWHTLPGASDFRAQCLKYQEASFQPLVSTNCKPHHPTAEFQVPDFALPEPDETRDPPSVRAPRISAHRDYLEAIIRWHASRTGHELCWENNHVLHILFHRLNANEPSVQKPRIDECMVHCARYRGAIEKVIHARPQGVPLMIPCPDGGVLSSLSTDAYCHDHQSDVQQAIHNFGCQARECPRALSGNDRHVDSIIVHEARGPIERVLLGLDRLMKPKSQSNPEAKTGA